MDNILFGTNQKSQDTSFADPATIVSMWDKVQVLLGSLRPACWGAKAYSKNDVQKQVDTIASFYNQIKLDVNNITAASSCLYLNNYIEARLNYDIPRLVNDCSKENAKKLLEIHQNVRTFLLDVYDYYSVNKSEAGFNFSTQIPTKVKQFAPNVPIDIETVMTGGGTSTNNPGNNSNNNPSNNSNNNPSNSSNNNPYNNTSNNQTNNPNGQGSTNQSQIDSTYKVITMPCGTVRVYRDGSIKDLAGNHLDLEECKKGSASQFVSDFSGGIDWGTGGVQWGQKKDNTLIYIIGSLIGGYLILNKKKK